MTTMTAANAAHAHMGTFIADHLPEWH